MNHHIINHTINLGTFSSAIETIFPIQILDAIDSMRPLHLRAAGKYNVWGICGIVWTITTIGSCFRYILYSHLFGKYKKSQLTPIDTLILVSALIQHFANLERVVFFTIIISGGGTPEHWEWKLDEIEQWLCIIFKFSVVFELYYSCVGSLGISIYRILYIKHDEIVKYKIGERNLLLLVMIGGVLLTTFMTLTTFMNDYENVLAEHCHIPVDENILMTLDQLKMAGGYTSPYYGFIYPRIINGAIMLGMTLAEICIYVAFFLFIYQHDNSENLRKILEKKTIKKRNKTNAITFFGQFCSFLFELIYWILTLLAALVGRKESFLWAVTASVRLITFSGMAAIDVLVSSSLRTKMLGHLQKRRKDEQIEE